jgi:outer membrane protein TolC
MAFRQNIMPLTKLKKQKSKMKAWFSTYIFIFCTAISAAAQTDSVIIFGFQDFMGYVRNYHPVVLQANLRVEQADNTDLLTRGQLDPKLYSQFDRKDFEGTQYYSVWESGLRIPTWFGADFKIGYEQNSGEYLNEQNAVPLDGQVAVGVSVPLLRNLVYNDRRVAIQQAQLLMAASRQERRAAVNELLYEATKVYWYWVNTYAAWQINAESVEAAEVRFEAVRTGYFSGDIPAVDTLESLIQLQIRQFKTQESFLDFTNAGLALSNFLWWQNQTPLELQTGTVPLMPQAYPLPILLPDSLAKFVAVAAPEHPEVAQFNLAVDNLDIQRKLSANNLLPDLRVDYSLLSSTLGSWEDYAGSLDWANNKVGVSFSVPLFLRKERGYLNQIKAKIDETASKRDLKLRQVENKIQASANEVDVLAELIVLYNQTYQNYEALYQAELRKFQVGESTLFLVNAREISAIDARLKRAELLAKYQTAYQGVWYSGGALE